MTESQQTITRETSLSGVGVHTGLSATITLKPAPPDHGIVFTRTDMPGCPSIPARVEFISGSERGTRLSRDGAEVRTVEHLLAALRSHQVDNLAIEMDGPEPPMEDGSALPFTRMLKTAGLRPQDAPRRSFFLPGPVYLVQGEGVMVALPAEELRIAFTIDFAHPHLRSQYLSLSLDPETFEGEIAPARTFGFLSDAEKLRKKGLIKGTTLQNTVVIGDEGVLNPEGLRFPDECVRHKILDLLGDLCLLRHPLRALIIAAKSGHAMNLALVRKIKEVAYEK